MKILRVRRGFTTNSSASSEWVPPQWTPGSKLPPPPGSAIGSSGTSPSGTPSGSFATTGHTETAPVSPQSNSNLATNGMTVGGLLGVVALLYLIERLVRHGFRSEPEVEADDE